MAIESNPASHQNSRVRASPEGMPGQTHASRGWGQRQVDYGNRVNVKVRKGNSYPFCVLS